VIIHPGYDPIGFVDDIAVVLLKSPFKYNKYVQPISIGRPPVEAIPGGTSLQPIELKWKILELQTNRVV
jgi:hypothetical protein